MSRVERALRGPAESEIESKRPCCLPVILEIQTVDAVVRHPGAGIAREIGLGDRSQVEPGEQVAGIGHRLDVRLQSRGHVVELEHAAWLAKLEVIRAEVENLVARFERVRTDDLAEIV